MLNEHVILVNAKTGKGYDSLRIVRNHNLVNNIRMMVKSQTGEMGYFFSPEQIAAFKTETDIPVFTARCLNGSKPTKLEPAQILGDQLPVIGERELVIIEIDAGYCPETMEGIPEVKPLEVMATTSTALSVVEEEKEDTSSQSESDNKKADNKKADNKKADNKKADHKKSGKKKAEDKTAGTGEETEEEKPVKKKKKGKWKFILLLILILAVGGEAYLLMHPGIIVRGQLVMGKQEAAIASYNQKIAGHDAHEADVNPLFEKQINKILEDYRNEKVTAEDARAKYDLFQTLDSPFLKGCITAGSERIEAMEYAKGIFAQAEEYYGAGKYEDAFASYCQLSADPEYAEKVQSQIAACAEKLLEAIGNPDTADACMDAISRLDSYIAVNELAEFTAKRQEVNTILSGINTNEVRTGYLDKAEQQFQSEDYAGAFATLEEGLQQIQGDSTVNEKLDSYRSSYITKILTAAEDAVGKEDYVTAQTTLVNGIAVYDDGSLQKKLEEISASVASKMEVYTAPKAKTSQCKGTITDDNTRKTYSFTPEVTGRYVFTTADIVYGMTIYVSVVDAASNETRKSEYMSNSEHFTVSLEAGRKYSIVVDAYRNTGDFTLNITHRKATVDVSLNAVVKDEIEAGGQFNEYTFTPAISGYYTFAMADVKYGMTVYMEILNPLDEPQAKEYLENEGYVNLYMNAGTEYRISVEQYRDLGPYTVNIGKQSAGDVVATASAKHVNLTFPKEHKYFTFTPNVAGSFAIKTSSMLNDCSVYVEIRDSLEKPILKEYMSNDEANKFEVKAGETYTVDISQYRGIMGFDFQIYRE